MSIAMFLVARCFGGTRRECIRGANRTNIRSAEDRVEIAVCPLQIYSQNKCSFADLIKKSSSLKSLTLRSCELTEKSADVAGTYQTSIHMVTCFSDRNGATHMVTCSQFQ